MRPIRTLVSLLLILLGVTVVLAGVLADPAMDLAPRVIMVLTGVLLVEASSWKRSNPFLPSTRRHDEFRDEVTEFLAMARRLDRAGSRARQTGAPQDQATLAGMADAMHASVDRMLRVAGRIRPAPSSLEVRRREAISRNEPLLGVARAMRSEGPAQAKVPFGAPDGVQARGETRADRERD